MTITAEQCDEIIDVVRSVRANLQAVYDVDRQLRHIERPDGYRASVRPMEGSPSATDDEGEPMPGHSDPTGSAVVTLIDGRASGVRKEINVMAGAVNEMLALARQANGAMQRALEPGKEHPVPDGCRNHEAHGLGWQPVHSSGRCRWCYDFWLVEGVDAPKALLDKRDGGRRISEADVDAALAHRHSKRARKRRRKAG